MNHVTAFLKKAYNSLAPELKGILPAMVVFAVIVAIVKYGSAPVEKIGMALTGKPGYGEKFKALFKVA